MCITCIIKYLSLLILFSFILANISRIKTSILAFGFRTYAFNRALSYPFVNNYPGRHNALILISGARACIRSFRGRLLPLRGMSPMPTETRWKTRDYAILTKRRSRRRLSYPAWYRVNYRLPRSSCQVYKRFRREGGESEEGIEKLPEWSRPICIFRNNTVFRGPVNI